MHRGLKSYPQCKASQATYFSVIHTPTPAIIHLHRRQGDSRLLREFQCYSVGQSQQALADLLASRAAEVPAAAHKLANVLADRGVRLVTVLDPEYPASLRLLEKDSPPLLYVQGDVARLNAGSIAVIGMRKPSPEGRAAAQSAAGAIVAAGFAVVSGNAPGADSYAHAQALESGGETLVFPPSAMDSYVQSFRCDDPGSVTVATCFPPGTKTEPWMFLRRNSLVAAHCLSAFVAETGTRGGTLDTLKKLLKLQRATYATQLGATHPRRAAHAMLAASGVSLLTVEPASAQCFNRLIASAREHQKRPQAKVPVLEDFFSQEGVL